MGLKYGLTAVNEYRIADYAGVSEVIVVLCGRADPKLVEAVLKHLSTHTNNRFFGRAT